MTSQPTYEVHTVTAEDVAIWTLKTLALPVGVVAATAIVYGITRKKKKTEQGDEQQADKLVGDAMSVPTSEEKDDNANQGQQSTDSSNIAP